MKIRVEYENRPIRHIAVQCPSCESWFRGYDITGDELYCDYDIESAFYHCPKCDHKFYGREEKLDIEEVKHPKIYEEVLNKKVIWK